MNRPFATITRLKRKRPEPEEGYAFHEVVSLFGQALLRLPPEERPLFLKQLKKIEAKHSAMLAGGRI